MGMAPDEIVAPRESTAAYPKSSVRALAVRAWWGARAARITLEDRARAARCRDQDRNIPNAIMEFSLGGALSLPEYLVNTLPQPPVARIAIDSLVPDLSNFDSRQLEWCFEDR